MARAPRGVVDCYRSMRSFERLTLNVRSKIQDLPCAYSLTPLAAQQDVEHALQRHQVEVSDVGH